MCLPCIKMTFMFLTFSELTLTIITMALQWRLEKKNYQRENYKLSDRSEEMDGSDLTKLIPLPVS